jgi:hypothetical protein
MIFYFFETGQLKFFPQDKRDRREFTKEFYLAFHSVKTKKEPRKESKKELRKESGLGIVTDRNYP